MTAPHNEPRPNSAQQLYDTACTFAEQGYLSAARGYLHAAERQGHITPEQLRYFHDLITAYRAEQKRRGL